MLTVGHCRNIIAVRRRRNEKVVKSRTVRPLDARVMVLHHNVAMVVAPVQVLMFQKFRTKCTEALEIIIQDRQNVSTGFTSRVSRSASDRICSLNVEVRELLLVRTVSANAIQKNRRAHMSVRTRSRGEYGSIR